MHKSGQGEEMRVVATNQSLLSSDANVQRSILLRTLKNNVQQLLAEELPLLRAELDNLRQDVIVVIAHASESNAASATPQPTASHQAAERETRQNSTGSSWMQQSRRFLVAFAPDKLMPRSRKVPKHLVQVEHSPWKGQIAKVVETEADATERQQGQLQLRDLPLLARYVRTYWSPYAVTGIIGGAGLMSFSAYQLYYAQTLRLITDSAIKAGGIATIQGGLMRLAIGLPISVGASLIGERLSARLSSRVANDIRYDLFEHLQDLSPSFHKEAKLGDLLARFSTDMEKIEEAMGRELVAGIGDAIMLAVSMWVMLSIQWQLAAISLLPIVVMRRPVLWSADHFAKVGFEMQGQKALMVNAAQEGLRALPLTKSFGLQKFMLTSFGDELKKLEDKNTEGLFGRSLFQNTVISSYQLLKVTTLTASLLYVATGAISFGSALAFMMVAENFYFNYSQLTSNRLTKWIDAGVGVRRLDELFRYPAPMVESKYAVSMPTFHNALRFENVSFGYHNDSSSDGNGQNGNGAKHHLQNINLTIEAGQFVAFVGPSGAGKSTIFNLLMRFYDVTDGSIVIDGYNLRDVTQASLCAQIGVVLQETFLFNTTIYDNIAIVKPEASEEEVIAAAKAAELHDFILTLPDGYQTIVGEGGGRLSGGQRQRIAIARALLHDPAILLLDEATSSLDPETAIAVNATLQKLARQRTVIMITHYLPSVVEADKIFVLKAGQLVEQGRHEDLLAHNGVYSKLWQSQGSQTGSPPRNGQ